MRFSQRHWIGICVYTWLLLPPSVLQAEELPRPVGQVLLEITGKIVNNNVADDTGANVVQLDLSMLESLQPTTIRTTTPWTEGVKAFEGVRINQLLEYAGALSNSFSAVAADEYTIDIDRTDFNRYPVIVAYKLDDRYMSVRELGPLWMMFPFDDFPELNTEINKSHCIWQLIRIKVE